MKILISIYIALFALTLNAQSTSFTKLFLKESTIVSPLVIELANQDLLAVIRYYVPSSAIQFAAKIVTMNANGTIKDSVTFSHPNRSLYIQRLIPTSYGYCLLGEMKENGQPHFWNARLDKQFNVVSQHFEVVRQDVSLEIGDYAFTTDSAIIVAIMTNYPFYSETTVAKISNLGTLINYKYMPTVRTLPFSISNRSDSLGYLLLGSEITATDTAFNVQHKTNLIFNEQPKANLGLETTFLKKNDTTFLCAGKWTNYNGRRIWDLFFGEINLKGETKFFKTIQAVRDTSFTNTTSRSIDTTKDGRFIYWGGTYNAYGVNPLFSNYRSAFILTKMSATYQNMWQKKYGGDAYYAMEGVLATNDGGCVMYGRRYNYNTNNQIDGIIIKVDGNGIVTSETSIPMSQSSITAYPNPSTGQLNFKKETPSVFERFDVSVFDISGKLVFQKKETDLSETIDLTHLIEGSYMYQIQQQGVIKAIGKWVKMK